jgi:hypothetical protein
VLVSRPQCTNRRGPVVQRRENDGTITRVAGEGRPEKPIILSLRFAPACNQVSVSIPTRRSSGTGVRGRIAPFGIRYSYCLDVVLASTGIYVAIQFPMSTRIPWTAF